MNLTVAAAVADNVEQIDMFHSPDNNREYITQLTDELDQQFWTIRTHETHSLMCRYKSIFGYLVWC